VAIPAVAVSGKSLPEMVKSLVASGDSSPQRQSNKEVPEQVAWNVTPATDPAASAAEGSPGVVSQADSRPVAGFSPRWPAVASDPLVADPRSGNVASPCWPVTPDPSAARTDMISSVAPGAVGASRTELASHREPAAAPGRPFHRAPAVQSPASPPAAERDPFSQAEHRLRQLGATYYLLESWGQQEQLYRFYCRVAVAGSPNYTRYFEATAAEPLGAMSRVLAEVEAWRGGR
jgi:hypothetical protein